MFACCATFDGYLPQAVMRLVHEWPPLWRVQCSRSPYYRHRSADYYCSDVDCKERDINHFHWKHKDHLFDLQLQIKDPLPGLPQGWQKKIPWLFPDISLTANTYSSHCSDIYIGIFFCNIFKPHRNHIIHQKMLQHSGLENRSAQENAFSIMKIVEHYAKHENQ